MLLVGGDYVVEGWVLARDPSAVAVLVSVDGRSVAADLGVPLPVDAFGTPLSQRSDATGWRAVVARKLVPSGGLFTATRVAGHLTEILGATEFGIGVDGLFGAMDEPVPGQPVGSIIRVVGWARFGAGVDRVEVRAGDGPIVRARLLAQVRPDLEAVLPEPGAALGGWEAWVPAPAEAGPDHELRVDAWAVVDGARRVLASRQVVLSTGGGQPEETGYAAALEARSRLLASGHRPASDREHLLVATHHLGLGGGQLYLQTLLMSLLSAHDIACTVLAQVDGVLRDELERAGARVELVGHPPTTAVGYEAWMQGAVARATPTGGTALIANTMGCSWGVDLADRLGIPSIWAVHESFPFEHYLRVGFPQPPGAWVTDRLRQAFAQADRVVFEADSTGDLFSDLIPEGRRTRIDYGIDLEAIAEFVHTTDRDETRRRLGLQPQETVLLCMATVEPRKAQALLVLTFARIRAQHPDAVLVLVGDGPGEYSRAVHELVDRLGLGTSVRILPVTSEVHEWYLAADALLLASDIESMSRAMLEAMAIGTPVIVSAVFGHRELIEDGRNGFLLDPTSAAAVTETLDRFLSTPATERRAVAECAREQVLATRGETKYAEAYRLLLGEIRRDRADARRADHT